MNDGSTEARKVEVGERSAAQQEGAKLYSGIESHLKFSGPIKSRISNKTEEKEVRFYRVR